MLNIEETKTIIDKAYNRAVQILSDNIDKVDRIEVYYE